MRLILLDGAVKSDLSEKASDQMSVKEINYESELNESKNERSRIYTSVLQEWELQKKKSVVFT